jgi:LPS export ABC transporter protein LptC
MIHRFPSRPALQRGIVLLALAAGVSFLATRDVRDTLLPQLADVDTRLNYALFDFKAKLLDGGGLLALTIEAPVLRNNARSGVGTVTRPEIFLREGGIDWRIRAKSAVVSADREYVSLAGEVTVVRYNVLENDLLEIDTRDLMVSVTPRLASTDARVDMRHAGDRLAATGMKLDLISDRFELLDDVSAVYDTP